MALTNMRFKDQNWSHFGEGEQNVKREKRREEEEEDGGAKIKANKVWNFGFLYGN